MFVRSIPWFGAMGYLGLTWMLLTAEIDGTSLEAHEVFGAPFIAALAIGLMVYSWESSRMEELDSLSSSERC